MEYGIVKVPSAFLYEEDKKSIADELLMGWAVKVLETEADHCRVVTHYGYEISKKIRNLSEEKYVIKETTLYSAFTRMQKNGYIVSFYGDETGGKRRTYYQITEKGRAYYYEKCKEWVLTKDVIEKFIIREECGNGNN